jgi:hypothetical protein
MREDLYPPVVKNPLNCLECERRDLNPHALAALDPKFGLALI